MSEIDKNIKNLQQYIQNAKLKADEIPELENLLEISELQNEIITEAPKSIDIVDSLSETVNYGLQLFTESVGGYIEPYKKEYDEELISIAVSGTSGSLQSIASYNCNNDSEKTWKYNSITKYKEYYYKKDNIDSINEFYSTLLKRDEKLQFTEFIESISKFSSDLIDDKTFSFKMRSVLEQFKGMIKKPAEIIIKGKYSKKKLSWNKMSKVLVLNKESNRQ